MKQELHKALGELNGLIFSGLREEDPDTKMVTAMSIILRLGQIEAMVEKLCPE